MNGPGYLAIGFALLTCGGLASSGKAADEGKKEKIEEVTAAEIEVNGKELNGQRRAMTCKFNEVTNVWVELLLKDPNYVGVFVKDRKGKLFLYAFADKAKFAKDLLKMNDGDKMRIIGTIKLVDFRYCFMIEEIQK